MASGDTKTNQYLDIAANGTRADLPTDTCCETRSQTLIRGVAERIMDVEDEVERLENNPDVVDIVGTYEDLENYDTSTLTDKDVIRVLEDETHDGDSSYYRYSTETGEWTYIASIPKAVFYDTRGTNTDGAMTQKATSELIYGDVINGAKIRLGQGAEANDTYSIAIGGSALARGTSTTLGALSSAGYGDGNVAVGYNAHAGTDPGAINRTAVGSGARAGADDATALGCGAVAQGRGSIASGMNASANAMNATVVGKEAAASTTWSTVVGASASSSAAYGVALGARARVTRIGEVNVGLDGNPNGYEATAYRVIGGVHDGVEDHDAVTVSQLNSATQTFTNAEFNEIFGTNLEEES